MKVDKNKKHGAIKFKLTSTIFDENCIHLLSNKNPKGLQHWPLMTIETQKNVVIN